MWYIDRKCMNMSFLDIKKQQKQHSRYVFCVMKCCFCCYVLCLLLYAVSSYFIRCSGTICRVVSTWRFDITPSAYSLGDIPRLFLKQRLKYGTSLNPTM